MITFVRQARLGELKMHNRMINSFVAHITTAVASQHQEVLKRTSIMNFRAHREFAFARRAGSTTINKKEAYRKRHRRRHGLAKPENTLQEKMKQKRVMFQLSRLSQTPPTSSNFDIESVTSIIGETLKAAQNRTRRFFLPASEGDRPAYIPLKMDGKWWARNIAVALLPAFILMIIFEYHIPQYEAFFAEVNQQEKDRLMDVMGYNEEQYSTIQGDNLIEDSSGPKSTINPTILNDDNKQSPSLFELIQRIESLEHLLDDKKKKERILRYELERSNQSGVQNRIEDRMIEKLAKERDEKNLKHEVDSTSNHIVNLAENVIALCIKLREEGLVIIDTLRSLSQNKTLDEDVNFQQLDVADNSLQKSENATSYSASSAEKKNTANKTSEDAKDQGVDDPPLTAFISWVSSFLSGRAK
jgi:hypothetical protein